MKDPGPRPRPVRLRRLLAGIEPGRGASRVLARLALLPLAPDAEVHLLHVLGEDEAGDRSHAEGALARLAEQLGHRAKESLRVRAELAGGRPHEAIADRAQALRADLVVIGRHGHPSLREAVLGTVADRVVRTARAPVLVVGENEVRPYRRLLAGVDFSEPCHRSLRTAIALLDANPERLDAVHAYTIEFEGAMRHAGSTADEIARERKARKQAAIEELGRFLDGVGAPDPGWRAAVRLSEPRRLMREALEQEDYDLAALGTRGRSGLSRMLLGSVAETVLRNARCDVLLATGR